MSGSVRISKNALILRHPRYLDLVSDGDRSQNRSLPSDEDLKAHRGHTRSSVSTERNALLSALGAQDQAQGRFFFRLLLMFFQPAEV